MNHNEMDASKLQGFQKTALIIGGVALLLGLVGGFFDLAQFWQSYLLAFTFWLQIGLGCLGFLMLHHIVGGRWSGLIRHILESGAMTLPLMALLFLPLIFGMAALYPWANAEHIQQSELLQAKSGWLNLPFFLGRAILYFAVWIGLTWQLNRWSLAEGERGDRTLAGKMKGLSAGGMLLFVITATFASFDWLMSLEPEWFSSIYGLLFIAGAGLATLAVAILGLAWVARQQEIDDGWVQPFNDLGNFLLGFVMIWAYFSFSQFLIIWSANIPEEAVWYAHRIQGGWQNVAMVLISLHFILPFLLLLSRSIKRRTSWLVGLAILVLAARVIDLIFLIVPAFHPEGIHFHWLDLVLLIAMGGGWSALFFWQWSRKSPVPKFDPRLGEAVHERHEEFAAT